jgi:hypothetical protein
VISAIIKDLKRFEKSENWLESVESTTRWFLRKSYLRNPVLVEKVRDVKGCVVESGV